MKKIDQLKEELEDEKSFNERLIMAFMLIIAFTGLFEFGLMAVAYIYADHISCNLLWCTFTTTRSSASEDILSTTYINHTTTSTSTCYQNGKLINCSDIDHHISVPGYIP